MHIIVKIQEKERGGPLNQYRQYATKKARQHIRTSFENAEATFQDAETTL